MKVVFIDVISLCLKSKNNEKTVNFVKDIFKTTAM